MTCIIVEDQPHAQGILEGYISELSTLELLSTFGDALEALTFLNETAVDLIFLDIHLPKLSGIDLLSILDPKPRIIFTTAFPDYALRGYELDAIDYLLKPFSFKRFLQAVAKAERWTETETKAPSSERKKVFLPNGSIFIKSGSDYLRLEKKRIRYIKADGDYTWVYTDASKHLTTYSLKHWLQQLPQSSFCQIHKSFLVNVYFIEKISGNQIYLEDDKLPIGRTFRNAFFAKYLSEGRDQT